MATKRTPLNAAARAMAGPDMLTISEAAAYVGRNEKTIRAWLAMKVGGLPLIRGVVSLDDWTLIPRASLTKRRKQPPKTSRRRIRY